jgi:hypothetical protein
VFTISESIIGLAGFGSADSVKTRATVNRVARVQPWASTSHIHGDILSFPQAMGESTEKKQLGSTRVARTKFDIEYRLNMTH